VASGFTPVLLFVRRSDAVARALVRTLEALVRVSVVPDFVAFLTEFVLGVVTERAQEPTEIEVTSRRSRRTVTRLGNGLEAHVDATIELFFAGFGICVVPDGVAVRCLFRALLSRVAELAQGGTMSAWFTGFGGIVTPTADGHSQQEHAAATQN
jgi:hypothetical protein